MADDQGSAGGADGGSGTDEKDAEITRLRAHNTEVLKEAKAARERLKAFDGIDPDEFKRLRAESEEAARKKATAEGDFETLKKQLVEKGQARETELTNAVTKRDRALEKRLVQAELTQALVKAGALPSMIELLVENGAKSVRIRETDDDFEHFVADAKGNPLVADNKATPMTIDDLVSQVLMAKFPDAFRGTGSSGSGAAKSSAGGGGSRVIAAGDNKAFLDNVAEIATGKVVVRS